MEDNNNNDQLVEAPSIPVEAANEVSQEQLAKIVQALRTASPTNFKARFQGIVGTAKPKVSKHWYNGNLISKADFDKLSWEEIHASNNVIRKG